MLHMSLKENKTQAWQWENAQHDMWLKPCEDAYYMLNKWQDQSFKNILDLGSGLGRHAILFAENKMNVTALDSSAYGIDHLKSWAENKKLQLEAAVGDMHHLPYGSDSFDAIFMYHVVSHTDTEGMEKILSELTRVLRPGGEIFITMCSKASPEFQSSKATIIDANTIIRNVEGPEKDIPHFYVSLDDILTMFVAYDINKIRHIDYCCIDNQVQSSKYYYINLTKK